MSKADHILDGDDFSVDAKLACAAAVRLTITMEVIEHHVRRKNFEGIMKCVESSQRTLFDLILQLAESNGCDKIKTFDHWLNVIVPDSPEPSPAEEKGPGAP